MRQVTTMGRQTEDESFTIIDHEVGSHNFNTDQWEVIRRVIHATADFEFKDILKFHDRAIEAGITALENGCSIIVDVKMIAAGLNQKRLDSYGCNVESYISDADVIDAARTNNSTRAIMSMQKAMRLEKLNGSVVAIGNAPTALIELVRLIKEVGAKPALIIGVPVGFVKAVESKEQVLSLDVPYIVSQGRKGGTTIVVSIIHALFLLSCKKKETCV
ncbi:MAG: precorrin-8X methylmutase [Candidatus Scalindua sp. AMX11]|nr:MAG: precorrin-8X methylmutase [Candidatus Scalindua sp.]NOG84475.1 precorrin-8X methylmutase [Planctomycetota bacterium]RZV80538.1 MAG: precorrin-8X methylmutase [Candidatus Scalindua sp. SCAELEC01]TDE65314.1 MAG: precorrin-8X methylmutase [Candidatus Scalindua sp. AMX11]